GVFLHQAAAALVHAAIHEKALARGFEMVTGAGNVAGGAMKGDPHGEIIGCRAGTTANKNSAGRRTDPRWDCCGDCEGLVAAAATTAATAATGGHLGLLIRSQKRLDVGLGLGHDL